MSRIINLRKIRTELKHLFRAASYRAREQAAGFGLSDWIEGVNAVSPGPIETPINDRTGISEEAKKEMMSGIIAQVPMKRVGTAEEVAKTVAFLASDDSSFITGVEIDVDGGVSQL